MVLDGVFCFTDMERNGNIPVPKSPTFSVEEKGKSSPSSYIDKMSPEKLPDALSLTGVSYIFIIIFSVLLVAFSCDIMKGFFAVGGIYCFRWV